MANLTNKSLLFFKSALIIKITYTHDNIGYIVVYVYSPFHRVITTAVLLQNSHDGTVVLFYYYIFFGNSGSTLANYCFNLRRFSK